MKERIKKHDDDSIEASKNNKKTTLVNVNVKNET